MPVISENGLYALRTLAPEGLDMIRLDIDRDGGVDGHCESCGADFPAPEDYDVARILQWALEHSARHRVVIPGRIVEGARS